MSAAQTTGPVLEVEGLSVMFDDADGPKTVLDGVSFALGRNEILGLVGETGAGKSVLARALIDLLPHGGRRTAGAVRVAGRDLTAMKPEAMRRMRGGEVALIGTNAKALLDPVERVGAQIVRVLRSHRRLSRAAAWGEAVKLLDAVGIVDPERRARAYPHELSGGMAQRVVIAMALVTGPKVILADDATLGLDATVSLQVLDILVQRSRDLGLSVVLITHDLGIVAHYCDRVAVMREGRIIEIQPVARFLEGPTEHYSVELLDAAKARPTPAEPAAPKTAKYAGPLLAVENLTKFFPGGRPGELVRAVNGVSFSVERGQTLALVGESGSGKTTVGQCLVRLLDVTGGRIRFDGRDLAELPEREFRGLRPRMQMVFQEPYVALDPRWTVRHLVEEPLRMLKDVSRVDRVKRVHRSLEMVGLPSRLAELYPHELTAGEQKRVGMARALATEPDFVVFDEPTTALDIRVRAQIIDLIRDLQKRMGLSALFITHDLNSVRSLAHDVAVMNRGKIVETGATEALFAAPKEAYTMKLLAAELPIEAVAEELIGRPLEEAAS